MARVTISYPNDQGAHFDLDYYRSKHLPLVRSLMGQSITKIEVHQGIGAPGEQPAAFLYVTAIYFDNMASLGAAMQENAAQIGADVANFTDIAPLIQIDAPVDI